MKEPSLHKPGNDHPIDELFAWMSVDKDGNEGILATPLPLVSSEKHVMEAAQPIIDHLRNRPEAKDYTFEMAEFTRVRK